MKRMYPLRALGEASTGYQNKSDPKSAEQIDGRPTGPAYLLLIRETVSVDSGWSGEGGSSERKIWDITWTYDRKTWEDAILCIEGENRRPNRCGKPINYLAFFVESIAAIETTIRIV